MFKKLLTLFFISSLILVGCAPSTPPGEEKESPPVLEEEEMEKEEEGVQSFSYIGTWQRQSTIAMGREIQTPPGAVEFTRTTFKTTGECTSSGTVSVEGNTMTMTMTETDCPCDFELPQVTVSTFEITDEGQTFTTNFTREGIEIMEVYKRQAD